MFRTTANIYREKRRAKACLGSIENTDVLIKLKLH